MFLQKDIDKFWSKVDKNGPIPAHMPHLGNCWTLKTKTGRDSSAFYTTGGEQHVPYRFSYMVKVGRKLKGGYKEVVCHHCDYPPCVRPDHLFSGTQSDNMKDAVSKGRTTFYHGKDHPMYGRDRSGKNSGFYGKTHSEETRRKLGNRHPRTEEQKIHLRKLRLGAKISEEHKRIVRESAVGEKHPFSKISDKQRREIYEKYHFAKLNRIKLTQEQLAQEYGIDQTNVSYIVNNNRWNT